MSALALSGCQSITANSPEAAAVRFVHLSPDAPAVDLYVNGNGTAYNLSFGTVTSYVPVSPGEARISANRAGTAQALVNERGTLGGTRQYTAVLSNALGNLQETVYPDTNTPAPTGMLALRVLNEAAGIGAVDVYLLPSGTAGQVPIPLLRNLSFAGTDGYVHLSAEKTYAVAVVAAGSAPGPLSGATLSGITVSGTSGAVRTLVLSEAFGMKGRGLRGFVLDDFDTP